MTNPRLKLKTVKLIYGILFCWIASSASFAAESFDPSPQGAWKEINESIIWCRSKIALSRIGIKGGLARDGLIYNIELHKPCNDPQLNAECLEALATVAPVHPRTEWDGKTYTVIKYFEPSEKPFRDAPEIEKYLAAHSDLRGHSVVIHKIPVCILQRRPKLFTENEIFSPSNCISLAVNAEAARENLDQYPDRIINYYGQWTAFFQNFPKATREEILDFEKGLVLH